MFGFFYCEIETPKDLYLGLLPVRRKGGLSFPMGSWSGWCFSEELKFAQENGYNIKVLKGYIFNRESDVFSTYVQDLYRIKSNTKNPVEKTISKSLLNNLLGRFGLDINKPKTVLVNENKYIEIA